MPRAKSAILLAFAAVMVTLVTLKAPLVNGPTFWPWAWRRIPALPVYTAMALAALPFFAGQLLYGRRRSFRRVAILLMMGSCFTLKLASVAIRTDPLSLDPIDTIVQNPDATSYYTDAANLRNLPLRQWLALYPDLMPGFNLHSQTKPPGPILYWMAIITLTGADDSPARVGGLLLGALATLSIPATYLLLKSLLRDDHAAFCGASFLALCPGFVLFFPMFDPTYILLSCGLIGLWAKATTESSRAAAVSMGLVLALVCVLTFNVLVVGFFCALYPIVVRRVAFRQYVASSLIVILTAATAMGLLGIMTGYDPIATFQSAWHNQHALLAKYADQRPYPATILFDLTDFALSSGWISFVLVLFYLIGGREHRALVYLCLAQLAVVAILGLLQAETARVWNFMLPLLMVPVGLELAKWPVRNRVVVLAALLLVTCAICQNMKFIY